MSILKEIYEYKIDFVNKQKKLRSQSDLLNKLKNITSQDFSFSKKLKDEISRTSIIGELKRASPSLGNFVNKEINLSNIAQVYEECGVSCLSILTDEKYFKGSINDLIEIRKISTLPILRKDFIVDEYQVFESKYLGADAILLIATCLTDIEIIKLSELAKELDLDVLVEIHSKDELKKVCIDSVDIIGVNNRNLKDFSVNVKNSIEIGKEIPESFVKISESGLYKFEELKRLIDFGYDGFLIGELFMREVDPGYKLGNLINQIKGES